MFYVQISLVKPRTLKVQIYKYSCTEDYGWYGLIIEENGLINWRGLNLKYLS